MSKIYSAILMEYIVPAEEDDESTTENVDSSEVMKHRLDTCMVIFGSLIMMILVLGKSITNFNVGEIILGACVNTFLISPCIMWISDRNNSYCIRLGLFILSCLTIILAHIIGSECSGQGCPKFEPFTAGTAFNGLMKIEVAILLLGCISIMILYIIAVVALLISTISIKIYYFNRY